MSKAIDEFTVKLGQNLTAAVRARLDELEQCGVILRVEDLEPLSERLIADIATVAILGSHAHAVGRSPIAQRIGPVYHVENLQTWLTAPGAPDLTGEAVRKRAKLRQLVAFLTDDRHWAFPAWQFDRVGGQLVPRENVITLWRQLPSDGFLTDADLATWMATPLRSLDGAPAEHVHERGYDSLLRAAVSRLTARAT